MDVLKDTRPFSCVRNNKHIYSFIENRIYQVSEKIIEGAKDSEKIVSMAETISICSILINTTRTTVIVYSNVVTQTAMQLYPSGEQQRNKKM